ncbi:Zinc finger protein-like 1 [Holothuria leucospilota]|uniref:Zinc finger protein-like 1 n=1 Tax=Holothuria leucospilota TaxID=206669 RepID=A0A9Q1HDF1_HOLLE|nr:Zinc finger protein-like 1 [Holothuria leucospilota]
MGLCKCPKRKVTNLFCFEHRVNVCEHCMVLNHPKCVVKSYLQWLQDSDYNSTCLLCNNDLSEGEVVRLLCYDVFHWDCLDKYAQQMPPNTAPAGYSCPSCNTCIFPQENMVAPVAEKLRELLQQVNWARTGLGLPGIEPVQQYQPEEEITSHNHVPETHSHQSEDQYDSPLHKEAPSLASQTNRLQTRETPSIPSTRVVVGQEATAPHTRTEKMSSILQSEDEKRKVYDSRKGDSVVDITHDHDTDKYKRRSALHWFAGWFKSRTNKGKQVDSNASMKRFAVLLILGLVGFFTLVVVMTSVGRAAADKDPLLDPLANPNVRIGRKVV